MDNISTPKRNQACHSISFIQGFEPSKLDMNVYLALENVTVPHTYPNVIAFKKLVESYSESVRKSWKTPIRLRRHWPWGQEHESSPLIGGRSDVKAYNISQSLSPTFERRRVFSSGSNARDIKEKLFIDAT
ncbi:ankyrin repeat and LEM domain-containing protein 2-like [Anneissia japonica]|uniref:ankyrin repeat and LEM domain-containing protein 2-like n=1 Tax=Anneissia japonica TaxID=1529436 RepID=UPI001425A103|nr:ankyrin repeat and LEM domain-containing protein 2-like [Anneissia japonica]